MVNKNEEKIYLHCINGIHKTGICIYTLLRWTDMSKEQAIYAINSISNVNYNQN